MAAPRDFLRLPRVRAGADFKLKLPPASLPVAGDGPILLRMQTCVSLTLNGEDRSFDGPVTVDGMLQALGLDRRKVAVECNEAIVPRSSYAETWLASGDAVEIVHFIGGG